MLPRRVFLLVLALAPMARAELPSEATVRYPEHPNVVNVKKAPYLANGDGVSDDTEALQRAINENTGRHRILYFPAGTYLVGATLSWPKTWNGKENWGFTTLQGESVSKSVIRLKDGTFTDPKKPESIMFCGGFGSADWFHNHVQNLTFNVGRNNAGAVGLQFYANNYGALRDCRIVSEDGAGAIGLDLANRDMNGPLLVRRVEVRGFARGVHTGHAVNSQTFEFLTLSGQTFCGFDNEGQSIAIRGLVSDNAVTVIRTYGMLALLDSKFTGTGEAAKLPALVNYNSGHILVRDLATVGYGAAVRDVRTPDAGAAYRLEHQGEDNVMVAGPKISEYFSRKETSPFGDKGESLRLPVEETPEPLRDPPETWAVVDAFGADPTGQHDSADAIQKAIDSGASTVFLPGSYALNKTVIVRGTVRHIIGAGGEVDYLKKVSPDFRTEGGDGLLTFEHFGAIQGGIENATDRPVVLRSVRAKFASKGKGTLYAEDLAGDELAIGPGQKLFARQLNIENEGTHFLNDRGQAWILGYKTERGGTLVETRGGKTEIFGTFSYTTTAGKLAPMFVTRGGSVFAFFNEVCYSGDPFATLIHETRGAEARVIKRGEGNVRPYVSRPGE